MGKVSEWFGNLVDKFFWVVIIALMFGTIIKFYNEKNDAFIQELAELNANMETAKASLNWITELQKAQMEGICEQHGANDYHFPPPDAGFEGPSDGSVTGSQ